MGKISAEYKIIPEAIGRGAFGEVRRAIHKLSGEERAIKIMLKEKQNKEDLDKLRKEVTILAGLDHPNILKVYEFYEDFHNFYIITELCTGGELFEKIISEG